MKSEDVLALIKAGFTADEVRRMLEPEQANEPEPASVPAPDPEPAKAQDPDQDPVQLLQTVEALRQQIEDLRSTFSAVAVRQDNFGGPDKETVGDVLASIINPKTKKEV